MGLDLGGRQDMNGYQFKDYVGFEKSWHLVTVRYRKDNKELRFVYANDIAYKAIEDKAQVFPEGSIFGKVGVATEDDPYFISSSVPSGAVRYQLMIKNSNRHKETNGWGYALFTSNGTTLPEDQHSQTQSCHACHQIIGVKHDYIFSQLMDLKKDVAKQEQVLAPLFLKFKTVAASRLPPLVRHRLPINTKQIRWVVGDINENIFQGTLDEIRPSLAKESLRANMPALLLNAKGDRYSIVYIDQTSQTCKVVSPNSVNMISVYTDFNLTGDSVSKKILSLPLCQTRESK